MWSIIISIIAITITIGVIKATDVIEDEYPHKQYPLKMPVWFYILMILIYLIPIFNILSFAFLAILYSTRSDFILTDRNFISKGFLKIGKFLTKEI